MEYSPMMVVMLWALTPSDASSVAAEVQEMPPPGMTVHQESYFTFNHGKPFLAEQDPLTGAILNLKTTPVIQDDYSYEEEEETDGIDRKDSPKIFTRNDIAHPSKDADLHKFLNLPVHYSSSGKFPLISSSYANTKVQGHSASAYSNHRLNPTSSTSTTSPFYYSIKTSPSATSTEGTTSTSTTTMTTTTSPTTTTTTTTTTSKPPTMKTTTKPPSSYEYEYEYDYDTDHEKEPTENKTSNHNILDFFDKDYELLGASEEDKNTSKLGNNQPTTKPTTKPNNNVVMVAPNTNIFIPSDYLKPNLEEKQNKTEYQQTTTAKSTTASVIQSTTTPPVKSTTSSVTKPSTESFIVTSSSQNKLLHSYTERPKPSNNEIDRFVPTTESSEVNDKVDHSIFGMKITNKEKQEVTTNKKVDDPKPTLKPIDKRPIVFLPTRLPEEKKKNETKLITTEEDMPIRKKPKPQQSDESKPSEVIVPPTRPSDFQYTFVKPGTRPLTVNSQQNGHYNPYQRPFTPPTMVPTEMLPPQRPLEHYPRPQERPYPDILQYRPIDQNRPQSNNPMVNVGNRAPIYNIPENKPEKEQTNNRPTQTFLPTPMRPVEPKPYDIIAPKLEPKPFATMAPTTSSRPGDSSSISINRPNVLPQRQEFQPRPVDASTTIRNPENVQKPSKVSNQPSDIMYPPYSQVRPKEPDQKPYVFETQRPQNPRPEQTRPPIVIPDLIHSLETQSSIENQNQQTVSFPNNKYPSQFNQPSKVESHFIKVSPGQENPSYSLQTSFSIGVPPAEEQQQGVSNTNPTKVIVAPAPVVGQGVGQVLFPDEEEKRPWTFQENKRPAPYTPEGDKYPRPSVPYTPEGDKYPRPSAPYTPEGEKYPRPSAPYTPDGEKYPRPSAPYTPEGEKYPRPSAPYTPEGEKYPRPSWESHLKPPLAYNHLRKEPFLHKRPKPRPDLPNILPQFRPNAKVGHADPHIYFKTPLDTLQPPPLPRPQFLRAESEEEKQQVHRRNGQSTRVAPVPAVQVPKRGALRSEDEKTDPVFVVYPSNNAQDGVVIGTRGPQRPLPPDNLELEDSFPLDTNKNFQARVDTPILKGKVTPKPVVKVDFPYPLVKPTEIEEKVITTVTKEYTAFSPTVSPTEKEHDAEINVIPYLQDYQPFATKKPSQEPPTWNAGNDTKPISVTLKTQKTEVTTSKIDNHKTSDSPTPQDFQAPFYASLSAPNQGWSVLRPRPNPEKEEEETTTAKLVEEQESKFDIQNFKPQLFGGFKPIIPPNMEPKEPIQEDEENL